MMLECFLHYSYGDDNDMNGWNNVRFEAMDVEDGKEKALQVLKRIAKRWRKSTKFCTCLLGMQKETDSFIESGYAFWLRQNFCERQALLNAKSSQCWLLIGKGKDAKD